MAYVHTGKSPVRFKNDPVDPDSTVWVYFALGEWLRAGETVSAHEGLAVGGEIETQSTFLGAMEDSEGVEYTDVYGIQVSVAAGATEVQVTLRVSTTTIGTVDLGRLNIDRTAIIPVKEL